MSKPTITVEKVNKRCFRICTVCYKFNNQIETPKASNCSPVDWAKNSRIQFKAEKFLTKQILHRRIETELADYLHNCFIFQNIGELRTSALLKGTAIQQILQENMRLHSMQVQKPETIWKINYWDCTLISTENGKYFPWSITKCQLSTKKGVESREKGSPAMQDT